MFFMSGTSAGALNVEDDAERKQNQRQIIFASLWFILGFSLIFISMGATATYLGSMIRDYQDILRKIGGLVIIVLGLHMMGVIQIKALLYEKRMHLKGRPPGALGAFLVGLSFALGWTPCIGPILGGILGIAASAERVSQGITLLALYSLGLAIPFFITAVLMDRVFIHFRKLQKHMQKISVASGVFLILVGVMIFTNQLQSLANYLQPM